MTPQERQLLADLFERVRANASGPRDPEAEAFIGDAVRMAPHAPYVLAQTTLVQQQALEAAAQRIAELEARAGQPAPAEAPPSFLGNLGKSLFGGASAPAAPPPQARTSYDASGYQRAAPDPAYRQPAYAPPPPAGPWGAPPQAASGGFLSNAMQTAAGVAGGIAVADLFSNLIGGRGGLFGGHSMGFPAGGETINNFYEAPASGGDQHAQDALQDADQDQDDAQDAQDASWDNSGSSDSGSYDT